MEQIIKPCVLLQKTLVRVRADLRTDDTSESELVRIARKLSVLEPKVQKRDFPSVEHIQDNLSLAIFVILRVIRRSRFFKSQSTRAQLIARYSWSTWLPLTKRYLIVLLGRVREVESSNLLLATIIRGFSPIF